MAGRPRTRARLAAQNGEPVTQGTAVTAPAPRYEPETYEPAGTPQQRETDLADQYLTAAQLAREVSHLALLQAYKDAKNGTLRDPSKTALNAAITSGTLLDKRLLLQERPTQITRGEDPKQAAQALARRLGVTIDTTAHEVPTTPELPATPTTPLLSERQGAKPPAHARETDAVD